VADSNAFTWLCSELEKTTDLSRLEARGTIRIALKQAGLLAEDLTPRQAVTVVQRVLPGELASRGIADPDRVCDRLATGVACLRDERSGASPDEIFGSLTRS